MKALAISRSSVKASRIRSGVAPPPSPRATSRSICPAQTLWTSPTFRKFSRSASSYSPEPYSPASFSSRASRSLMGPVLSGPSSPSRAPRRP